MLLGQRLPGHRGLALVGEADRERRQPPVQAERLRCLVHRLRLGCGRIGRHVEGIALHAHHGLGSLIVRLEVGVADWPWPGRLVGRVVDALAALDRYLAAHRQVIHVLADVDGEGRHQRGRMARFNGQQERDSIGQRVSSGLGRDSLRHLHPRHRLSIGPQGVQDQREYITGCVFPHEHVQMPVSRHDVQGILPRPPPS